MTKVHPFSEILQVSQPFTRDRLTWLAYAMLAYFAYLQASLGSILPFLRAELHLDYALVAWHFSAFGTGMILAGLVADQLIRRFGLARIFWGGGIGMACGGILIILGQQPWMTLLGALVMALPGTLLLVAIQSILANRHRERLNIALAESNLGASVGAGFSALCVGGFAQLGMGWRSALIVPILAIIALTTWGRQETPGDTPQALRINPDLSTSHTASQRTKTSMSLTASQTRRSDARRSLPPVFWANWLAVILLVSVEWSLTFWAASFLQSKLHIDAGSAATLLALYLLSTMSGRLIGSRLTRIFGGPWLLVSAIGVNLLGFSSFWLASNPLLVIAGLLLMGLGAANLWPQSITLAFAAAPQQAEQASASVSLAGGLAICVAPLLLGTLANITSLTIAYSIVPCLLITALIVIMVATVWGSFSAKAE